MNDNWFCLLLASWRNLFRTGRVLPPLSWELFLYVDYSLPLEPLRNKLTELLQAHPKWDRRVANIQVTDTKQNYKELRVLLSSMNSSVSWDLRVDIREKLIDYINTEFPGSFVRIRIEEIENK